MYGLTQETITRLQDIFSSFNAIEKVILFGSRAKEDFREGSDIDFAVRGKSVTLDLLLDIKLQIDALDLPYHIDLIDYESTDNNALKEHIDRVGKVFYEAPEARF